MLLALHLSCGDTVSAHCFLTGISLVCTIVFSPCTKCLWACVCMREPERERERERHTGTGGVKKKQGKWQFVWWCRHLAAHMDMGDNWPERCLHSPMLTTEDGLDKMSSLKWSCGKLWPRSQSAPETLSIHGGGRCEYFENIALCHLLQLKFASQRTTAKCQWSINSNNLGCRI